MHAVDMTDADRPRTPKASVEYLTRVIADNGMYPYEDDLTKCSGANSVVASVAAVLGLAVFHAFFAR